jgi:hypothetical protein
MGNYYSTGKTEYSSEELDSLLSSIPCKNKVIAEKANFREISDNQSRYQFISNGILIKKNCDFVSNFHVKLFKGNTLLFDSGNNPDFKYKLIIFDFDEKSHFSLNGVKHLPISLDKNNDIYVSLLIIGNNDNINDTDNFLLEIGYDSWENVNTDFSASLIRGMGYEFFQGKTVFRYSFLRDIIEKYCKLL